MTVLDAPPALLQVRGATRRLGTATALDHVDLSVDDGEFLAVTGPPGSGKSTLLHTLGGLERPDSGEVLWQGEDLSRLSDAELARHRLLEIGLVFQQFHLLRHLTLLDNVLLPGLLARTEPRAVLRSRAGELLERLDVGELADHGVGEASGGQLQRVAIARALINRPRLLVADEPTGALDSAASDEVMGALAALHAEGMTIVLVTHDPGVAARADRGVRMVDGRLSARAAATTLPAAQEPPRRCS